LSAAIISIVVITLSSSRDGVHAGWSSVSRPISITPCESQRRCSLNSEKLSFAVDSRSPAAPTHVELDAAAAAAPPSSGLPRSLVSSVPRKDDGGSRGGGATGFIRWILLSTTAADLTRRRAADAAEGRFVGACRVSRHVATEASEPSFGRSCFDVRSNTSRTDDDDDDDDVGLNLGGGGRCGGYLQSADERLDRDGLTVADCDRLERSVGIGVE